MAEWKGPAGSRHVLTKEDKAKGRSVVSERRSQANAVRNLKHGKRAKALAAAGFEFCDGCAYKDSCVSYKPGEACSLRIQILKQLNKVGSPEGSRAWLNVALRTAQDLYVLSKTSDDEVGNMHKFQKQWIELGKVLFPKQIHVTNKDQEIRIVFDDQERSDDANIEG